MIKRTCSTSSKAVIWIITFLLTLCMHIQNKNITPATSQIRMWHPITNKFYCFNCRYYSLVYKKSCSQLTIFVSCSVEPIEAFNLKYIHILIQVWRLWQQSFLCNAIIFAAGGRGPSFLLPWFSVTEYNVDSAFILCASWYSDSN